MALSSPTGTCLSGLTCLLLTFVLIEFPPQTTGALQFRLIRGGQNDGLLQMLKTGWSDFVVVCSKSFAFSRKEADVLCKGLGLNSGHSVLTPDDNYLDGNETFPEFVSVAIDFHCFGNESQFGDCVNETRVDIPRNETCRRGISVLCTSTVPRYRIISSDRRLEVNMNSEWTSVCADGLTVNDAEVACKTNQEPWSDARPLRVLNSVSRGWKLRDLRCSGSETTLEDCSSVVWGDTDCYTGRDVGVLCEDASDKKFRLMNGSALSAGRLEFRHKDRWGTICSRGNTFSRLSAKVICKSLGLEHKSARVVPVEEFGVGDGVIWMNDVRCIGHENNLLQCDSQFDGNPIGLPCTHAEDVAVSCESYKLEGGTNSGHLQVSYQERWINIYNGTFNLKAATVACRALGMPRSGARYLSVGLEGDADEILGVSSCKGSEETLFDCQYEWLKPSELRTKNISVGRIQLICEPAAISGIRFRHPGQDSDGIYEVNNGTHWGTICGNGLGENEARVACRNLQLGSSFAAVLPTSYTGKGNGTVLMDGVSCKGNENSLAECDHNPWGVVTCDKDHRDDLNIYCGEAKDNFDVRLSGGDEKAGRVEVKIYGSWGTACSDGFDNNAARVVCRQLKLPLSEPRTVSIFSGGEGRIWLHRVNCTGEEESIRDCKFGPLIGQKDCTHDDDIGVVCSGTVVTPASGLSGGGVAGIVIAILILFVILIVALCVGIRKWSAARRDIGNNLLKTATPNAITGERVEYSNDNGVVNMGFNESPNASRDRSQGVKLYSDTSAPHERNIYNEYGHNNSDADIMPPAYHTLDVKTETNDNKPVHYGIKSPPSEKYQPEYSNYPRSYGAPPSAYESPVGYRPPGPDSRSPKTLESQGEDGEFGFNENYKNQNPYQRNEPGYPRSTQPQGRIMGRQASQPQTENATVYARGYNPGGGYDNENMLSPGYRNPRSDSGYSPRPQQSPTRFRSSSREPQDPTSNYSSNDIPEGTSV